MNIRIVALLSLSLLAAAPVHAVDVDEIISGFFENTGGHDAWAKLQGVRMTGEFNQGGMKFPFETVQMKDGREYTKLSFQGKELKQGVFDGETMWNTNFMTMKAEKADAEATANKKLDINDFPESLFDYKAKGYSAELMGKETIDGTETYKVKLTKEPVTIDGKKVDDITYYYFDTDALVPLVSESEIKAGPAKGKMGQSKLGDYQEVGGLYFPYSLTQGIKDGRSVSMEIKKIELNPKVSAADFALPVEKAENTAAQ